MWKATVSSGHVECLEIFGSELTIVNAARVSFGNQHTELTERDVRLIQYLVKHQHWSPFRHVFLRFHIVAPEFVMRQWYKHVVGAEWTSASASQLHGWNEISQRYTVMTAPFYRPSILRRQSLDNKQGSDGVLSAEDGHDECLALMDACFHTIEDTYRKLLEKGVAKEQARVILPMATMTQVLWTCSLQALIHFIVLRRDAQHEIREFALELQDLVQTHFPITFAAFTDGQ